MVSSEQVETMIRTGLPDAQVQVQDLTGTMDHYKVVVVSAQFEGKRLVQRHQLVYGALRQALSSDAIHALTMETYTPEDWAELGQAVR
jgi:acid stress-induced BolA-like protein IbaG/YrbA